MKLSRVDSMLLVWFQTHEKNRNVGAISESCEVLADDMAHSLPDSTEKSEGLKHLLMARDAFVRAAKKEWE